MKDPYGLSASGLPPELAAEMMGLSKREALAQALLAQSQEGLEAPAVKGRFQGSITPLAGAAKVIQAMLAQQGVEKAGKERVDMEGKVQKSRQEALAQYEQMRSDPRQAAMFASQNPLLANNPVVAQDIKATEPRVVGRSLMRGTGELIASDPVVGEEREARGEQARAAQEARAEELRIRLEDRRISQQERAANQRELAQLMASLRPPVPPQPLEAIQGPDGKPVLVPRAEAVGKTPSSRTGAERNVPAPVLQAMATNEGNLRRAQTALDLLEGKDVKMAGPDGKEITLKGDKSATGLKGYLPDALLQRTDKQGIDARAVMGDLGSMVIHDRSGAAVTAAEFPRLRPFIPLTSDDPETAKKKLRRFVAEYHAINAELKGMFSEDQGYRAQPSRRATDQPGAAPIVVDW